MWLTSSRSDDAVRSALTPATGSRVSVGYHVALALLLLALLDAGCARPAPVGLGSIVLDTKDPKYQTYFNQVRERIKSRWAYPRDAGEKGVEGEVLIEFHIAKDGRLEYIALQKSSGVPILDDYALNAVRLAQPFPPAPDDIAKQTLTINGSFHYQMSNSPR